MITLQVEYSVISCHFMWFVCSDVDLLRCIEGFFLRTLEMHFNELLCRRDALQYCNVSGVERLVGVVSFVNKERNRLFIRGTITLIECQNDPTNYDSAIINQVWEPTIQACEWNNRTMRASHQSSKHGMEQLISNKSSILPNPMEHVNGTVEQCEHPTSHRNIEWKNWFQTSRASDQIRWRKDTYKNKMNYY